jgi:hypothetical protein
LVAQDCEYLVESDGCRPGQYLEPDPQQYDQGPIKAQEIFEEYTSISFKENPEEMSIAKLESNEL